jgi:hypothetical protein
LTRARLNQRSGKGPRRLVGLSLAFAVAAAYAAAVGWRGGDFEVHVAAGLLWLVSGALACRARTISRRCPLGAARREALLGKLCGLTPLEVRVSAVNAPESIRYARELRNVVAEADWPVVGVYKRRGDDEAAGVALAVRNILAPPGEAIMLVDTLRRVGIRIVWAHKPALGDDRTVEIQVGQL